MNSRAQSLDVLNRLTSFQTCVWEPISSERSIASILSDIREEKYAQQIAQLRDLLTFGDSEGYGASKKRLPCVTFCGCFDAARRIASLRSYNNLMVFDIDHLDNTEITQATCDRLARDEFVLAVWTSPSGNGIKGLVQLDFEGETPFEEISFWHGIAFDSLSRYFRDTHDQTIDPSGRDITRLCFLSSDPALHQKKRSRPFIISREASVIITPRRKRRTAKQVKHGSALTLCHGKNRPEDRCRISSIIKYLQKRGISITSTYDQWVKVAMAIANTFSHNIGEGYFLRLCQLDGTRHDSHASKELLISCYYETRGEVSLGTLILLAQNKGYRSLGGDGSTEEKLSATASKY